MDIKALLKYYTRYKWLILFMPVLCIVVTYFLVKDLPQKYVSQAQISTGLIDESQKTSDSQNLDYFKVSTQFGNIIEMIKTRTVLSLVSNSLILHDLENPSNSFMPWSAELKRISNQDKPKVLAAFTQKLAEKQPVIISDNALGNVPLYDLVESMGYTEKDLLKNLKIQRSGESDFITIAYVSTNPDLSAFVVNTLAKEFLLYNSSNTYVNQKNSLTLLDSLLKEKERVMNERNASLKNYKIGSGVLNLDKQSDVIYTQISQYEAKRAETINQIQSLKGALKALNSKLSAGGEASIGGSSVAENNEIIQLENQLKIVNQRYINNNFRAEDKKLVDSLTALRAVKVANAADKYISSPSVIRKELADQRMKLETDLALAQSGISSIETELSILRGRYNTLVPTDAGVQNLERDADVATKEYLDALARYNQTSVDKNTSVKLHLAEIGLPGTPEPSKGLLYVVLSGFAGLSLCLAILTLTFMFDRRIYRPNELATATGLKVVGSLNMIQEANKDLRDIWGDNDSVFNYSVYKDLLRSLRFEVDKELEAIGGNVLGISSLGRGDGKTFLSSSLAYAFAMTGKRVLLISENTPSLLSVISNKEDQPIQGFESFLVKKEIKIEDLITILNRNPGNKSLLEMKDSKSLVSGFAYLKDKFELIIIDMDSLQDANRVKEWMMFAQKILVVFSAGSQLNDLDKELIYDIKKQTSLMGMVLNKVTITTRS